MYEIESYPFPPLSIIIESIADCVILGTQIVFLPFYSINQHQNDAQNDKHLPPRLQIVTWFPVGTSNAQKKVRKTAHDDWVWDGGPFEAEDYGGGPNRCSKSADERFDHVFRIKDML